MQAVTDTRFKIVLRGHFQLFSPQGEEISISGLGEKSKGLIAILATRPGQPIARTYLQDKLWSDRGELQGRNSLKQALRQARALFNQYGVDVIRTDGGPIMLDPSHVWIDIHDAVHDSDDLAAGSLFLEGIGIKDPQFTIWLDAIRQSQSAPTPPVFAQAGAAPLVRPATQQMIGVMPVICADGDQKAQILGNMLVDRIVNAVSFYELFGIHDFRQSAGDTGRGCNYVINAQALSLGDDVSLSISMRQTADNRRLWGHQVLLETKALSSDRLAQVSIEIGDRLVHSIDTNPAQPDDRRNDAAKLVMEGIDRLFRPSKPTVRDAVTAFEEACALEPKSSYLAWQAYSSAHVLELDGYDDRAAVLERTEHLAAQALERDPYNPLTRILLTHVYSFIFRDLARADSLIGPLQKSPPDTPLYYYFLGCLRNYQQDLPAAKEAAFIARKVGRHSPYAHLFSSLATMTASMSGDFETAIRMGEESLARQPRSMPGFGPTMRYLASAYVNSGRMREAGDIYDSVKAQNPDFDAKLLLEASFPVPSPDARSLLFDAFSKIESAQA